jgi:hypothetical protein
VRKKHHIAQRKHGEAFGGDERLAVDGERGHGGKIAVNGEP